MRGTSRLIAVPPGARRSNWASFSPVTSDFLRRPAVAPKDRKEDRVGALDLLIAA
ncbi:hypothetical protein [Streptomyces sp. NPDC003077]|uniref:hypothetical protein n=1 Tax=Streptomyces sp. NPDC003077 TaxID=3154443 RepID=UPI0033B8B045